MYFFRFLHHLKNRFSPQQTQMNPISKKFASREVFFCQKHGLKTYVSAEDNDIF